MPCDSTGPGTAFRSAVSSIGILIFGTMVIDLVNVVDISTEQLHRRWKTGKSVKILDRTARLTEGCSSLNRYSLETGLCYDVQI